MQNHPTLASYPRQLKPAKKGRGTPPLRVPRGGLKKVSLQLSKNTGPGSRPRQPDECRGHQSGFLRSNFRRCRYPIAESRRRGADAASTPGDGATASPKVAGKKPTGSRHQRTEPQRLAISWSDLGKSPQRSGRSHDARRRSDGFPRSCRKEAGGVTTSTAGAATPGDLVARTGEVPAKEPAEPRQKATGRRLPRRPPERSRRDHGTGGRSGTFRRCHGPIARRRRQGAAGITTAADRAATSGESWARRPKSRPQELTGSRRRETG